MKEYQKKYYEENKKLISLKNKKYYQNNIEKIKLQTKKYKTNHEIETKRYNKLYGKQYRLKNNALLVIKRREYNNMMKLKVLDFYTEGKMCCACCGERILDFLTVDHVNNDGKKHRKELGNSIKLYTWLIKNKFPEGFQILCFNCNCGSAKQNDNICPHKKIDVDNKIQLTHPRGLPEEAVKGNVDKPLILRVDGSKFTVGL